MIHCKLGLIPSHSRATGCGLEQPARVVSCGSNIVLCERVSDLGGEGNRRQD